MTKRMNKPLQGKTILVTRAKHQAGELIRLLQSIGAKVVHFPSISITPPKSWSPCDQAIDDVDDYDWIIFSSSNAVDFFLDRFHYRNKYLSSLKDLRIAAIGSSTAANLMEHGLSVALIPNLFHSEGLSNAFARIPMQKKKVLLPKGEQAGIELERLIQKQGAEPHSVTVYRTQLPTQKKNLVELYSQAIDLFTFTSPLTFKNTLLLLEEKSMRQWIKKGAKFAVIGPVTAKTVKKYGFPVAILPKKPTILNLVNAIQEYYQVKHLHWQ